MNIAYARFIRGRNNERYYANDDDQGSFQYLKKIAVVKKNLIKIILLGIFIIIFWPVISGNWSGYKINYQSEESSQGSNDEKELDKTPVMLNPKFYGEDEEKNPYVMKAVSAVSVTDDKVVLYKIDGDIKLHDNNVINIKSINGDYYTKDKVLNINEGVVITSTSGYILSTDSAHLDIEKNIATGSQKVTIEGVLGDITADGFTLDVKRDYIEFFGNIELNALMKPDKERKDEIMEKISNH